MRIHIINGPNLNLLGIREPDLYGFRSFSDFLDDLKREFKDTEITYFQSNHEGDLIDQLQEFGYGKADGIILNPAAYTHTSIALGDTLRAITTPVVEVHLTIPSKREPFRKQNFIRDHVVKVFEGEGLKGYRLALRYFLKKNPGKTFQ